MKIKIILLNICLSLFLFSCTKKSNIEYVIFSGKASNHVEDEISVYGVGNKYEKTIEINEDGTFSDTLHIKTKGYYALVLGRERTFMYLDKADQLAVTIDANQFDESLSYTGTAADVNNYLKEKNLALENLFANGHKDFFTKEASVFKKNVKEFKTSKDNKLKEFPNLSEEFIEAQIKDNHYEYLLLLNNYQATYRGYTKNSSYQTPEGFLSELEGIDFDNEKDYNNSDAYKQLCFEVFYKKCENNAKDKYASLDDALIKNLSTIKSDIIKNAFITNIADRVAIRNENAPQLYNKLKKLSSDDDFKKELTTKFEKIKKLIKGNVSPTFSNYENYKGGTTSLADLKGKYVYIDIWATWCGPCKIEIPHLQKIENEYHDKNIHFVSVSIDQNKHHDQWKNMIVEKKLSGIQLFADKNWESQFIMDYHIQGIPRFLLIDPNGIIVNADAPRPSDPKLIELFNALKI